jgi:uncharacterized membrane protein YvbJ
MPKGGGSYQRSDACPHCGATVPFDDEICPYCGTTLQSHIDYKREVQAEREREESHERHKKIIIGCLVIIFVLFLLILVIATLTK